MLRLVVATQNFPPRVGGIEQLAGQLCAALASQEEIQLTVVAPDQSGAADFDSQLPYRVVRYGAPGSRELPLAWALRTPMRSADACLCMQFSSLPGALLWRGSRAVQVATMVHGKEVLPRAGRLELLRSRARRSLLRRADAVLAVSRYSADRAASAGALPNSLRVVHPGVDTQRFRPMRPNVGGSGSPGPRLLTVCRLVERKGVDTVIEALPDVLREVPDLTYSVVGDGPDRPRLEKLVEHHGLGACVQFLGRVPNDELLRLYSSASLFVMVSRTLEAEGDVEGFGLVLLEAQACGVPVVAARSGGMPDAVAEGRTGFLVEPGDSRALATQLVSALRVPERLLEMRSAARAFAQDHSWLQMALGIRRALTPPHGAP